MGGRPVVDSWQLIQDVGNGRCVEFVARRVTGRARGNIGPMFFLNCAAFGRLI